MSNLTSLVWWKAAGTRALRTALVILVPYAPTVLHDGNYLLVLSAAGFGAVTSILTSLFGISETSGTPVSWYWAVFERSIKTAAQALLTAFGTATVFGAIHWSEVPALVGSAVLGTILLTVLKSLPEATVPTALGGGTVVNTYAASPPDAVGVPTAIEVAPEAPAAVEPEPIAEVAPEEPIVAPRVRLS